MLLEAEVVPRGQPQFEKRYKRATRRIVSPGKPKFYMSQDNKWGTELRVYFNNPLLACLLKKRGIHVESTRRGYKAGEYLYRINSNKLWWELVEDCGLRLGLN